jgi:5-amino-6-(5-phosphoribosylamino)uracil reductase
VPERPYVLVSCAMSADGYIDDRGPSRLVLSGEEDLDRVDEVRASCDAIMVGAGTIRRDDPRLVIRSAERRARRAAGALPESPVKVTLTRTGDLPRSAAFFTAGPAPRLVYCARPALARARAQLSGLAEVIDAGDAPSPAQVLNDLYERSVTRLLIEGGGQLATSVLTAGLADELQLVVAPFFVGDPGAPRFAGPGPYPNGPGLRMRLAETRPVGDVVLLRYLLATQYPPGRQAAQHGGEARPARSAPQQAGRAGPAPQQAGRAGPAPQEARRADQAQQEARPWPGLESLRRPEPQPGAEGQPAPPTGPMPDPRTEHIRWLRETIRRLSADEQPPAGSGERDGQAAGQADPRGAGLMGSNGMGHGPGGPGPVAPGAAGPGETAGQPGGIGGGPGGEGGGPGGQFRGPGGPPAHASGPSRPGGQDSGPGGPPGQTADVDVYWLRQAIELARRCPPSPTAFSVGAVIVAADGTPLATGFSRERDLRDHAEEVALAKLRPDDPRLAGATIYSSLEPCGVRASRPRPCADLIITAGIPRVVYAWHEPPLLAVGGGAEMLQRAGVSVTEIPELAAEAREMNAHLINR